MIDMKKVLAMSAEIERNRAAIAELVEAMKDSMAWQVKNVQVWDNPPYDRAARLVAQYGTETKYETKKEST